MQAAGPTSAMAAGLGQVSQEGTRDDRRARRERGVHGLVGDPSTVGQQHGDDRFAGD